MSTVVLGVGNLLLSDDGVGIHAIRMLRADAHIASAARLIDGGTVGPDLIAQLWDCERLLIIDAVDVGLRPGAAVWMDYSAPNVQTPEMRGAHQSGLAALLDDLRLLGRAPREVMLLGVQPAGTEIGTQLSPGVQSALPVIAGQVALQIERWTAARVETSPTEQLRECI